MQLCLCLKHWAQAQHTGLQRSKLTAAHGLCYVASTLCVCFSFASLHLVWMWPQISTLMEKPSPTDTEETSFLPLLASEKKHSDWPKRGTQFQAQKEFFRHERKTSDSTIPFSELSSFTALSTAGKEEA